MDMIAIVLFVLFMLMSVCFLYAQYQIRRMREALRDAAKVCEDAVNSLRSGKG